MLWFGRENIHKVKFVSPLPILFSMDQEYHVGRRVARQTITHVLRQDTQVLTMNTEVVSDSRQGHVTGVSNQRDWLVKMT